MSFIEEEISSVVGDVWKDVFKIPHQGIRKGDKRPEDVHHRLKLSLEKLYNGASIRIRAEKKIPCTACSKPPSCAACQGTGFINLPQKCSLCLGAGTVRHWRCGDPKCVMGLIKEEKYFSVTIPAGAYNGQKIVLKGQGDALLDKPDTVSDIVCIVNEVPHDQFQRCYNDLYYTKTIDIRQALCGCMFSLKHLDGRAIAVRSQKGSVIKPGDMRVVVNEGMPIHKSTTRAKGDLIIMFNVEFPKSIDKSVAEQIEALLPEGKKADFADDSEECNLVAFDPKDQVYHVPFQQKELYEDSPLKGPGPATAKKNPEPKPPQCAQQ